MSMRFENGGFTNDRMRRAVPNAQSFPSEEFSVCMRVFHHVRTLTQYQTYFIFAQDSFGGGDEYTVAFAAITGVDVHFGIGSQGNDTYHASAQPVIDRWYDMVYRVRKRTTNDYEQLFYPDAKDLSISISRNRNAALTFGATSSINFGAVPYTTNEGIDGRMDNLWIFKGALPIHYLARQCRSMRLLNPSYRSAVWGNWPCHRHDDLRDYSGHGRNLSLGFDDFGSGSGGFVSEVNAPGLNSWREPVGQYIFDVAAGEEEEPDPPIEDAPETMHLVQSGMSWR